MQNCDECNERLNKFIEIYNPNIAQSLQYNSIVLSVGYLSFFSILYSVQKHIDKIGILVTAILMLSSVFLYVMNEVWKMYLNQEYTKEKTKNWLLYVEKKITLNEMDVSNVQKSIEIHIPYQKFYPISLYGSIITAFFAVALLIYYCFLALIK